MNGERSAFVPWQPPRLVPAGPGVAMQGPGSTFAAGELVGEGTPTGRLLQLADRRR